MSTTNYDVTPTLYPNHKPNTYKAYNTVGGWTIEFLDPQNGLRPIDGGKIYRHRQNAQTRARQLNRQMTQTVYQYWAHKSSGDVFAIRLIAGEVVECAGPLDYREVTSAKLQTYDFSGEPEDVQWCKEHQDDFRLCEEPYSGDEL